MAEQRVSDQRCRLEATLLRLNTITIMHAQKIVTEAVTTLRDSFNSVLCEGLKNLCQRE